MELVFTEPGSEGSYEEIKWYKGQTGSSAYRLVFVHSYVNGGEPKYYNEYCSGSSPCYSSEKVELNVDTGNITINKVQLSDEGYYYYKFYINGGVSDTGHKYEIRLEVHGKYFYSGNQS